MMPAKAEKEHEWLQKLVGDWTFVVEFPNPEQGVAGKHNGTTMRSIGGLWVIAEGQDQMPGGGDVTTMLTLGYDPQKKEFVGTWLGSMMTYLWVYEGSLDASGKVLTLETEGPDFKTEGKMVRVREVIELKSDQERTFSSYALTDSGEWQKLMTAKYTRTK